MLMTVMREVRNGFWDGYRINGVTRVRGGKISLDGDFKVGDYILLFDNGVFEVCILHKSIGKSGKNFSVDIEGDKRYSSTFRLKIPPDFLKLVSEIEEYCKRTPNSGIISEQFGEYRYTMDTGADGRGGTWEKVFQKSLNRYRKMHDPLFQAIM